MLTIAIITWPFMGHINPTLSLGKCLLAKGYKVIWLSEKKELEQLIPSGGEFIELKNEKTKSATDEDKFGLQSIQSLYEQEFMPRNEHLYRQLQSLVDQIDVDYIVTDQQAFAGALFAHVKNIPFAVSVTTPATIDPSENFPEVYEYEQSQVLNFQQNMGCDFNKPLVWSSPVTLIYTTKEFLQKETFPDNYYFIGPSINHRSQLNSNFFLYGRENRVRPLILVTMGATIPCEVVFVDKIISALEHLNVDVVMVASPDMKSKWPKNFHVFSYIPQLRVLDVVDLVICHAGHNTVVEALNKGIPIVAIPIVHDQSYIAGKVVKSGAGLRLKYKRLTSGLITEAVNEILANPAYKLAAQRIEKSFQLSGGEQRAANIIEKHIAQFIPHSVTV